MHRGERIDVFSRGLALRSIETMTWLFDWLHEGHDVGVPTGRLYSYFNMLRGQFFSYEFRFDRNALELAEEPGDDEFPLADDLLDSQLRDSIAGDCVDMDLFVRMSLSLLGIDCEDSPPPSPIGDVVPERYIAEAAQRKLAVFAVEFTGNHSEASRLVRRQGGAHSLWIVRQSGPQMSTRKSASEFADEVLDLARLSNATLIDALDFLRLIRGVADEFWSSDQVIVRLLSPGQQGSSPIGGVAVGSVARVFEQQQVFSLDLLNDATVQTGDSLYIRTNERYERIRVTSLQVQKSEKDVVTGPCRVGIKPDRFVEDVRVADLMYVARDESRSLGP